MKPAQTLNTTWSPLEWEGETAWISTSGKLQAIVSASRSRLIFFGPPTLNLLDAPQPKPEPSTTAPARNWGGHRFWLGPQKKWNWPPSPDWEHAASSELKIVDEQLIIHHPQTDNAYPPIVRTYSWTHDARLRCECKWGPSEETFYGMHILAVTPFDSIDLRIEKTDTVPLGYLQITQEGPLASPNCAISSETISAKSLRIHNQSENGAKLGFPLQTINLSRGNATLKMSHGEYKGCNIAEVDEAHRSQIW